MLKNAKKKATEQSMTIKNDKITPSEQKQNI